MILMPALAGKAAVFTFIYGAVTWPMLSGMAVGMYYAAPMVAVYFFFSTQHQIAFGYYMFIYYFTGNLIYGVSVYEMIGLAIDRPCHALYNLYSDVEEAENNPDYKLETYLLNFKPSEVEVVSNYRVSEKLQFETNGAPIFKSEAENNMNRMISQRKPSELRLSEIKEDQDEALK